ncbi:MAG: DUF1573 domain-containing protein [candidate division Zixibacteria bacterium]|nr:DUF1573 domain-containing protein [candidate division Zixibacteria bacterium]
MRLIHGMCLVIIGMIFLVDTSWSDPALTIPNSIFDFGLVPQNSQVSCTFWLHSTGTDTLNITDVKPGCGCTKTPLNKTVLASGDSTDLEVIFSTGRRSGKQSKRPSIETNEGELAKYVEIKADVITAPDSTYPIRIAPYKFDISQFGDMEVKERKFVIENVSDQDLAISLVYMPEGIFRLDLPQKVKAGDSEGGKVTLRDDALDDEFEKSITIEVNDDKHTRFSIPVKRTIRTVGLSTSSPANRGDASH